MDTARFLAMLGGFLGFAGVRFRFNKYRHGPGRYGEGRPFAVVRGPRMAKAGLVLMWLAAILLVAAAVVALVDSIT
jgi:hypothetical protein